jgi:hypothetical protein
MDFLVYVAGPTLPARFKATRSPRNTRRAEGRLVVLLAGREAELRLRWRGERGNGHDWEEAVALADEIAGRGPYSIVEADALLQLARVRARRLVRVRWRQVRAVAEALIERRRLGGRELREIVRRVARAQRRHPGADPRGEDGVSPCSPRALESVQNFAYGY